MRTISLLQTIRTKTLIGFMALLGSLCMTQTAHAETRQESQARCLNHFARKLVTRFWDEVKHQDVNGYSRLLAPGFQGINTAGAYTRTAQIVGLQGLTVTKFKLTKLIASRHKDTIVVSYDFLAKGKNIVSGPSIDVWQKVNRSWKQISHTYVPFE